MRKFKQKDYSLIAVAIESSWKFSAVLTIIPLVITYAIFPILLGGNSFFKIVLPILQSLSILFAVFFGFIAVIKFLISVITTISNKKKNNSSREKIDLGLRIEPILNPNTNTSFKKNTVHFVSLTTEKEIPPKLFEVEPIKWSLTLLNSLDWKRFEDLCSAYFTEISIKNHQTSLGADQGIDIFIYENNSEKPTALVQCKRWSNVVGVIAIREFLGVMHNEKVSKGYFFTTSKFNKAAIDFANNNNLNLIDGEAFLGMIGVLPKQSQSKLLSITTSGDYTTPTCVRCGTKLILKESFGKKFWGCKNFPRCRITIQIKSTKSSLSKSRRRLLNTVAKFGD